MARDFRDRNSLETQHRLSRTRFGWVRLAALALLLGPTGCNIVQGFQEAGDTLFPQQSTHLAAPGLRLVAGEYRSLDLALGADLYLLARGADDANGALFAMRYADPKPCVIAGVGAYSSSRRHERALPMLAYFHEAAAPATLHFADTSCKLYDLEFADARLPISETESSIVVWAGSDLWLATPENGSQARLATAVDNVIGGVFGAGFAVLTDGHIALFGSDWKQRGLFGEAVGFVRPAGNSLFFADSAGVHRIIAAPDGPQGLKDELLAADACALGLQDSTWATFRSPCSGGSLIAVHEPTGNRFTLPFDADPQRLKLVPARQGPGLDPTRDPFWFFSLSDGASADSQDTLVVRTPSGSELRLGAHATLNKLRLLQSDSESYGYALVEMAGDSGRYLWWNAEGQTKVLAEAVLPQSNRLIVDFDGSLGTLAVTSGDRLLKLAEGIPWPSFEYRDESKQWTVLFHDLNLAGQRGALSAFYGDLDDLQATPIDQPFSAPEFLDIAPSVGVFRTAALDQVLSGVIYLADFNVQTGTGRLEYRNLELRFTGLVNYDVSDYIVASDQVLYAIPHGAHAGIWLVSGK